MKVVIDTNVLVSAALRDRGPQVVIEWILTQPDCEWVVSPAILIEYDLVLARPRFGLTDDLRARWRLPSPIYQTSSAVFSTTTPWCNWKCC